MNTNHLQISMRKKIDSQYSRIQELEKIIERVGDCIAMDLSKSYVVGVLNESKTKDKE